MKFPGLFLICMFVLLAILVSARHTEYDSAKSELAEFDDGHGLRNENQHEAPSDLFVLKFNVMLSNSTAIGRAKRDTNWKKLRHYLGIAGACAVAVGGATAAVLATGGAAALPIAQAAIGAAGAGGTFGGWVAHHTWDNKRRKRSVSFDECPLLEMLFEHADINKDGKLSFDEFYIDSSAALNGLSALDVDNSSYLEPNEIHPCLAHLNHTQTKYGHARNKRFTFLVNGQEVYNSDYGGIAQGSECDQNRGTFAPMYYVPSQQVIYF